MFSHSQAKLRFQYSENMLKEILAICTVTSPFVSCSPGDSTKFLKRSLLHSYDPMLRPADNNESVIVTLGLNLYQIIDIVSHK